MAEIKNNSHKQLIPTLALFQCLQQPLPKVTDQVLNLIWMRSVETKRTAPIIVFVSLSHALALLTKEQPL